MSKLFTPATNTQAYLKAGLMGFAGDGKTYTAGELAIGLVQLMRERGLPDGNQPVANAVALMAFDSDASGVKPHVFLEAGNDKRVTAPAAAPFFRMYALRDEGNTTTDVFSPIDFPQGFRGTRPRRECRFVRLRAVSCGLVRPRAASHGLARPARAQCRRAAR